MLRAGVLLPADGVKTLQHAPVDGGRGLAVQLLIDDGLDQRLKGGLCAPYLHGEGAGTDDEFAQLRVSCGELLASEGKVIAWAARARAFWPGADGFCRRG